MAREREFSPQTLAVLMALCAQPRSWRHGYDVARETGLKSGTLYPIFIRLADRGLLEARWEETEPNGRPKRHLYRLTSDGLARSKQALSLVPATGKTKRAASAHLKPAMT
jgi:PadR family transcriptional regulator, regulatory protein PadR